MIEQNLKLVEVNDVNGGSNREPLSDICGHDSQVTHDCHEATACNRKLTSKVKSLKNAIFNVKTLQLK